MSYLNKRGGLSVAVALAGLTLAGAANADVLIVGAPGDPSWINDVQAKIAGSGVGLGNVDVFNAQNATPTAAQLAAYDAVMVFSDFPFFDKDLLGDRMADYSDAGGGVVEATFALSDNTFDLAGRWAADGYSVFTPGAVSLGGGALGTIYVGGHPILNGVTNFNGGANGFHNNVGVAGDATRIADWTNGVPLLAAANAGGIAGLNFYPPSSDARNDFWDSGTDGDLLMANALLWTIPEPTSASLVGLAGAALLVRRRRA